MGQFKFTKTKIAGVLVIEPKAFFDERGFFMETFNHGDFERAGFKEKFLQDNLSRSSRGVLRGLHYQINPAPMGKLVHCLKGKIFDVGVDVRAGSPTFGQYHSELLSEENKKMLYLPPGFAHGFLALAEDNWVYYKCTGMYSQENERALLWNDPDVGIPWPLDQAGGEVIVSERDKVHPGLKNAVKF